MLKYARRHASLSTSITSSSISINTDFNTTITRIDEYYTHRRVLRIWTSITYRRVLSRYDYHYCYGYFLNFVVTQIIKNHDNWHTQTAKTDFRENVT